MADTEDKARVYVERLERLMTEADALASDIKDVCAEAKDEGFDVPALKKVAKLRMKDAEKQAEARTHLFNVVAYAKAVQLDLDYGGNTARAVAGLAKLGGGTLTGPGVQLDIPASA